MDYLNVLGSTWLDSFKLKIIENVPLVFPNRQCTVSTPLERKMDLKEGMEIETWEEFKSVNQ